MCLKRDVIDAPQSHYAEVGGQKNTGVGSSFRIFLVGSVDSKAVFQIH